MRSVCLSRWGGCVVSPGPREGWSGVGWSTRVRSALVRSPAGWVQSRLALFVPRTRLITPKLGELLASQDPRLRHPVQAITMSTDQIDPSDQRGTVRPNLIHPTSQRRGALPCCSAGLCLGRGGTGGPPESPAVLISSPAAVYTASGADQDGAPTPSGIRWGAAGRWRRRRRQAGGGQRESCTRRPADKAATAARGGGGGVRAGG